VFIRVLNVRENVLDVFLPFLHPELFQWYNSWLTIFFTNVHMLYLFVQEKSTTFIILLHNEECKKLNGVTWRGFVRTVKLLYQLILVKWFVRFIRLMYM